MLILASKSPRRAELLRQIGVQFSQCSADIDETPMLDEQPENYVLRMAAEKSKVGFQISNQDSLVLGADTVVIANGKILGKPYNKSAAQEMLHMLSDNTHKVMTAVALTNSHQQSSFMVETEVTFCVLTDQQIDWYCDSGEPMDKAGSYGIQGLGGQFVKHIKGSYSAVVGLPLYETKTLLTEMGYGSSISY